MRSLDCLLISVSFPLLPPVAASQPRSRSVLSDSACSPLRAVSQSPSQQHQPRRRAASRQAPDSLFPEQGSSKYDVKHYAISLGFQSSGDIKAKTTLTAKAKKPLTSFSLDLEGLIVDKVRVNGRTADFSRHDNKLIIKPSKVLKGRFSASIRYHGKPVTHIDPDGAQDGWIPTDTEREPRSSANRSVR